MAANLLATLGDLERDSFVPLLSKLIGESKHPPELIPQEDRVVKHVLDILLSFSTTSSGGPLLVNHVTYHAGRGNLIIEYPCTLTVDGDKLRGRGTTDCLGHVALVTELVRKLGETKSNLKSTIVAVFIANEENSAITGVGVDALVKDGLLNKLKDGPLYWIDTADKQPGVGTGGMIPWKLHVTGRLFHSGLAHKSAFDYDCVHVSVLGMDESRERCSSQLPTLKLVYELHHRNKNISLLVIGVRTSRLVYDVIGLDLKGHKCARASHGCSKGNSVVILSRLPTSSSGTGLWVCNPFNHETNPMELSRRWNQSNSRGMYYFRRCQINSILQVSYILQYSQK
ncbi:hypothetical protein JHK87_002331 [Glycine soja]|nr:hypothetical protein JHK87_002331 [Glycine soja]